MNSAGGVPKVVAVAADSDIVFGYIYFDIKDASFVAGSRVEIAQSNNVIYLYANAAIARGVRVKSVQIAAALPGAIATAVAASGAQVIGTSLDEAVNVGDLIRVKLMCDLQILA